MPRVARIFKGLPLRNVGTPVQATDAVTLGYLQAQTARATATTPVGTSAGNITGLSLAVAVGTYRFKAWIPIVVVGTTNVNFGLTGPTTSAVYYTVTRSLATGTTRVDPYTSLTDAAAGTAIVATLAEIEGTFVATAAGTLQVRGIRANDGTSMTTQIGSYLFAEKIA